MQSAIQNFKTRLFNSISQVENNENEQENGTDGVDEEKERLNNEESNQMTPENPPPPPIGTQLSQTSLRCGLSNKYHIQLTRGISDVSTDR